MLCSQSANKGAENVVKSTVYLLYFQYIVLCMFYVFTVLVWNIVKFYSVLLNFICIYCIFLQYNINFTGVDGMADFLPAFLL